MDVYVLRGEAKTSRALSGVCIDQGTLMGWTFVVNRLTRECCVSRIVLALRQGG